ncbi:putative mitochondrial protein AtMg00310 [Silene latifolia]|uniref:putative mitochondrial protein AtMg00310 n=1 Tax=Silene latifolia TaxID=37657 RepID=UPI003D78669D
MVSRFLWGHEEGKRGMAWVSWKAMGRPKAMGGLSFRDFENFNLALLGKQAWRLAIDADCLWVRLMKAKYFPNGNFMADSMGHEPSYTWRGIVEVRAMLEKGLRR